MLIALTDDAAIALTKVLDSLSPATAGLSLSNDAQLADFIEARLLIAAAAQDAIQRERVIRHG